MLNQPVKIFTWIFFTVFVLLLTKNILFKKSPGYYKSYFRNEYRHYRIKQGWENANKKPFSTIKLFYNSHYPNPEYKQNNLWGNLLGFVPLGIFLPLLITSFRSGINVFFAGLTLSLCFELAQLVFGLGIFDVDDLLLNTAGCFSGYIIYWLVKKILKI